MKHNSHKESFENLNRYPQPFEGHFLPSPIEKNDKLMADFILHEKKKMLKNIRFNL